MKKILWIAVAAITVVCLGMAMSRYHTITPSGKRITETRQAATFSGISAAEGIVVYLQQGSAQKVVVRTDQKAMQYIITQVQGGKLTIRYADNVRVRRIKTEVYVTAKQISSLSVSSGAEIEIKGTLSGETLSISASSAGDIEGKVEYRSISASASSGGDIDLSGKADRVKVSASSGSEIDFGDLRANIVMASASSGSDVDVWAVQQLNATASSGADISYRGNPTTNNISRSSGGKVRKDN